jgi:hypothetical protein
VFRGLLADLAAAGEDGDLGDSPTERGYAAIMRRHRERKAQAQA